MFYSHTQTISISQTSNAIPALTLQDLHGCTINFNYSHTPPTHAGTLNHTNQQDLETNVLQESDQLTLNLSDCDSDSYHVYHKMYGGCNINFIHGCIVTLQQFCYCNSDSMHSTSLLCVYKVAWGRVYGSYSFVFSSGRE